jgi:hypothetical protein
MAVNTVVVEIFGNQSPSQTVGLMKSIAPYLTAENIKKAVGPGPVSGPGILVATHTLSVRNGSISVTLRCVRATCSGVAELNRGAVVLARSRYLVPKAKARTVKLALTTSGQSALRNAAITPVQVTLQVTVSGGKTLSKDIFVT